MLMSVHLNPWITVCLIIFFFLFAIFSAGNLTSRVIRSPVTSLAHPRGGRVKFRSPIGPLIWQTDTANKRGTGAEYFQRLSTILEGFRMALEVKDVFLNRRDSISWKINFWLNVSGLDLMHLLNFYLYRIQIRDASHLSLICKSSG